MEETHLSQLGRNVPGFASPEAAVLERVPNPHLDTTYLVRFTAPEFTSLCPVTGQPDFAHLVRPPQSLTVYDRKPSGRN
jgi:7-cyano-7-deazaguanine reductase